MRPEVMCLFGMVGGGVILHVTQVLHECGISTKISGDLNKRELNGIEVLPRTLFVSLLENQVCVCSYIS